jgi:hypothetical protein
MFPEATATFTHPDWVRAVSAQLPGAQFFQLPASGFPRLTACLTKVPLPLRHYDSWQTPLTSGGLPTAAPGEPPAIAQLLDSIESPVLFRSIPIDHPVGRAILEQPSQVTIISGWERAGLHIAGTFEGWLAKNFSHQRRKELKRLRARLAEQGDFQVRMLERQGELSPFVENFIELEKAGWKGARGTAIANNPKLAAALRQGLSIMHERGRVRFWEFALNGKPIASLYALIDGAEACLGKMAYDESLSRYSPGVLVILEATQALFAEQGLTLADSNAIPNHPMIDRIWRDRIACADILVAGNSVPVPAFRLLSSFIVLRHNLRAAAKSMFVRVTGRKVS